jgi:hypothetical protein
VLLIVVPLAVFAAFLYALSDFFEQRAARRTTPDDEHADTGSGVGTRLAAAAASARSTLRRLIRDRLWFAGWAVGTCAYLVQAVALRIGSVSVVQALQVSTLIFTLPLAALGRPINPRPRDWLAGAATCGGLILFLLALGRTPPASQAHRGRLLFLVLMLVAAIATLTLLAALRRGPLRATLLACAAGTAFAANAGLVKLTAESLTGCGIGCTATDWTGYALAGMTILGVILQQLAFASGALPVAATAMVVTNPAVGTILAILGFGDRLPTTPAGLATLTVGATLTIVGVTALTHSPLLRQTAEPVAPEPPPVVADR